VSRVKPNLIDRVVSWANPRAGLQRLQYRQAVALFEGAERGRRTKGWRAPNSSIQSDTRRGLTLLRARSRDLAQNNAHAAAAHREIPAAIVGHGITPHLLITDAPARARAEALTKAWFDTTACDAQGQLNFYGIQNLIAKSIVESGEALVVRRRRMSAGIPLQIEVLEPDHIDTSKDGTTNGNNNIIQGIEYSPRGRRVAYWLYDHHPGDQFYRMTQISSRRIPASEVLHIYRIDRPGQVRGVPWGAPVLLRLRDFDEYTDAQLIRQKIAACFSVFIKPGDQFGALASTADPTEGPVLPEKVEPGMIEMLDNGKEVAFGSPPGVSGFGEYATTSLHEVAAGYGVPYSVLTGDLRQVNFSSGRLGLITFYRNVTNWQQHLLIPQLCEPVWRWFAEAAQTIGAFDDAMPVRWSPPRRQLTDPAREIPAIRDAVRSGLITHREAIRQQGFDPDDFIDEVREFNDQLDERGLVFDTDPRRVSSAGLSQPAQPDTGGSNAEDE